MSGHCFAHGKFDGLHCPECHGLPKTRERASDLDILKEEVQALKESIHWLEQCVHEALKLCATVAGAPVRPEVVLDEEWSS